MSLNHHRFCELFAQLGLPSDVQDVSAFIRQHSPLADHVRLEDAPFWSPAQAALLRDELLRDADWSELVDQLNLALRGSVH